MLRQQNPSDVDVAITPEELEGLDEASIQALYNQRVAEERARNAREVCPAFRVLANIIAVFYHHCSFVSSPCLWMKRLAARASF